MVKNINNTFEVNKKRYDIPELDFNAICDLESMGVSLGQIKKTPTEGIRAFFALCFNGDKEIAGTEIQSHIENGGEMDVIAEALGKAVKESGFFRAIKANKDAKTLPIAIEAEVQEDTEVIEKQD